jgi:2-dehydro-3-deoxygluconokinase
MAKIVTFGEIMMRLATPGRLRFRQTESLDITFAGAEANVAVSCSRFGHEASFVTALPASDWGDRAVNAVRAQGVATDRIVRRDGRMGLYFLESGAGPRPSRVIYDRGDSAISRMQPDEVDWSAAMQGVDWFHWTGITPALGDGPAAAVKAACEAAKAAGAKISADLNYRKNLWSRDKAQQVMSELAGYLDVCIANEEDAHDVFGITGGDVTSGELDRDRYADVAKQMTEKFGFGKVAITLRESISASRNGWSAMLYADGTPHFAKRYDLDIVDRVGGGDSFAAGLITALMRGDDDARAVEWATAASALKHTIVGDFNLVDVDEVDRLAGGDASGRVRR